MLGTSFFFLHFFFILFSSLSETSFISLFFNRLLMIFLVVVGCSICFHQNRRRKRAKNKKKIWQQRIVNVILMMIQFNWRYLKSNANQLVECRILYLLWTRKKKAETISIIFQLFQSMFVLFGFSLCFYDFVTQWKPQNNKERKKIQWK